VFLSWRDSSNPEGGGAETFMDRLAAGLVATGHRVTIMAAAHNHAPADEIRNGIRYVRRGTKTTVYPHGWWLAFTRQIGQVDLYVDVQNGMPFFARTASRTPVIVLVHHVHREQWQVVYPGRVGRIGWWVESELAPRVFRHSQYIAVSHATRRELTEIGVAPERIAVVHNGHDSTASSTIRRAGRPTICVLGRLVPHKRIEHAINATATLRQEMPDLHLVIVGDGWWRDRLYTYVAERGLRGAVTFTGHVDDDVKHDHLSRAWVLALPSLKEGWGLVVGEAARHGVPAVAYASAGGTVESVRHEHTGLLVDDEEKFTAALRTVLTDRAYRDRLGAEAQRHNEDYTWGHATDSFESIMADVFAGRFTSAVDPE
jgi:glycosyltransferase involved in cell wall biosynthesis